MNQPSSGGDVLMGAIVAAGGAAIALIFLKPPVDVPPPVVPPAPEIQMPSLPNLPGFRSAPPGGSQSPPAPPPAPLQIPAFDPRQWLDRFSSTPVPPAVPAPAAAPIDLAAMSVEEMRDRVGMRVFRAIVQTDQGWGSCGSFPIAPNRIATALHCVRGESIEFMTADESQSFSGRLVWSDPGSDAAVFEVDVSLQPFPLGQAVQGEPVWAFGYPSSSGNRLTVTPSQVADPQRIQPVLDVKIPVIEVPGGTYSPGNSGGPLLNRRGEVVGFAHAILENPPHIGYAIPVGVLPR